MPTNDAAGDLWCPFAKVANRTNVPVNRYAAGPKDNPEALEFPAACMCIGSDCMAWRWSDDKSDDGYCGLAGRPQGNAAA